MVRVVQDQNVRIKFKLMVSQWLQAQTYEHGAVLFRNFPFSTPKDFDTVVKAFGWKAFPYVGGT